MSELKSVETGFIAKAKAEFESLKNPSFKQKIELAGLAFGLVILAFVILS